MGPFIRYILIFGSTRFVHNIEITDCGDANGKHGTSSNACERTLANDIKQTKHVYSNISWVRKICTAQVKGKRHTLTLKKGKTNIKIVQPANAFSATFSYLYVYIHPPRMYYLLLTSCILYRSESSTNHSKCSWK